MLRKYDDSLDFTNTAYESMYKAVDNERFYENDDADLIYEQLEKNLRAIPFGDYLTLNFFIYSQKTDEIPIIKRRYMEFVESTNEILKNCYIGEMYTANPYECFLIMCMLSDDPLGTYADVWELSYHK
ncbi:MAG: hypothetical protein ACI4XJ_05610 [Eubacteriales bacterium]